MTNKRISQLVSKEGKPVAPATSAPGCFIHDGVPLEKHPAMSWGRPFADPCSGNDVAFYVTGEEYFAAIAAAIAGATRSIYITGWQVNFDVELISGRTLFQCLETALEFNPTLQIYVMPWLSPKVGVDTGDFETMLAVFHLNSGLPTAQAFALPAIAQSDMSGALGIGFSHHQKLVVIDDQRAFVGGIDLAYGRRDDGVFSLAANGRVGNELYNPCVPPVHELSNSEQTGFLTRAELLAACFDGAAGNTAAFLTSAPAKPLAAAKDVMKAVGESRKDAQKVIGDWWATADLMPEFVRKFQDVQMDAAQGISRWAYHKLDRSLHGKIERLRQTGSAHAVNAAAALTAWLNNASMEQLPPGVRSATVKLIETFAIATLTHLSNSANARKERYANLRKLGRIVPTSGKVISKAQPRMPWHDVQCSITGPAVSDLSSNFVRRWNGIAKRYERSYAVVTAVPEARAVFDALGIRPIGGIRIPRLPAPPPRHQQPKRGKTWVQVLRSAPSTMQIDEANADQPGTRGAGKNIENGCLKAMLTAIHGAQKFIYIEGQFFQSAYGVDSSELGNPSGPMAALIDITSSPGYEKHAKRLGILGVQQEKLPGAIRWSQVDDVRRDIKGRGADFMNDLDVVLRNIAAIEASRLMGERQAAVLNPIGEAIAQRIENAVFDGLPFHVYMVLPVHPEGTLNTLNIMNQVHVTMQSLVFGSESLVNRIRRSVLAAELRNSKRISRKEAIAIVANYDPENLAKKGGEKWTKHLTLLNLRTWQSLENRPVTEQVYVHSKLLIADDRVAILGSANINDRSQLGGRDSELAAVFRDDEQVSVKLDGVENDWVSKNVHNLRIRLWRKLFGLMASALPANSLSEVVGKPAARGTWEAIQRVSKANALAYQKAFPFLAKIEGMPSSVWPTWEKEKRALAAYMPFNERFWRDAEVRDEKLTWDAKSRAPEKPPAGIQGFIVALPVTWTDGENNNSGMNLTMLASNSGFMNGTPAPSSIINDERSSTIRPT